MTWKEFKKFLEVRGVKDEDTINYIDIAGDLVPNHALKVVLEREDDGSNTLSVEN